MGRIHHANRKHKKVAVVVWMSGKADFKTRNLPEIKRGILCVSEEDVTVINEYLRVSKYMKEKLTEPKGEI